MSAFAERAMQHRHPFAHADVVTEGHPGGNLRVPGMSADGEDVDFIGQIEFRISMDVVQLVIRRQEAAIPPPGLRIALRGGNSQ